MHRFLADPEAELPVNICLCPDSVCSFLEDILGTLRNVLDRFMQLIQGCGVKDSHIKIAFLILKFSLVSLFSLLKVCEKWYEEQRKHSCERK